MEFSGNSVQPHNFSTFEYLRKTTVTVDSVNSIIMISESSEPVQYMSAKIAISAHVR